MLRLEIHHSVLNWNWLNSLLWGPKAKRGFICQHRTIFLLPRPSYQYHCPFCLLICLPSPIHCSCTTTNLLLCTQPEFCQLYSPSSTFNLSLSKESNDLIFFSSCCDWFLKALFSYHLLKRMILIGIITVWFSSLQ